MLKLALRNIKSKPWRTVATIVAIAVGIAMIFAMLSFKSTVFDYIASTETAVAGSSDIKISTHSSSDRITTVAGDLKDIDGVEDVIASLYLYAELNGEYVQARGFETGALEKLQTIEVVEARVGTLGTDDVVISQNTAKHFGVKVGDELILKLGNNTARVYVGAIAKTSGYFLGDSPYLILGNVKSISALVMPGESSLCNEIYIKTAKGADVNGIIESIKGIEQYADMQVALSHDYKYIDEQTTALTAPVVLAGAAVLMLAVAIVAFIFLMSEKEKVDFIARLKIVGATNGQLLGIFLIESVILACIGGLVGSAFAVGAFVLIVRLTLKTTIVAVNAVYLFAAAVVGIACAILGSLYPIFKSMKGSVRQHQTEVYKPSKPAKVLPIVSGALAIISLAVECSVYAAAKYLAIVSVVLVIITIFSAAPMLVKLVAKLLQKSNNPSVKTAAKLMPREKRFARASSILTVGIAVSVTLFMAWNITTTVFNGYIKNFENVIFVSNIKSNVAIDGFENVDGVESATKMVWQKSELSGDGFEKTVNLLGSFDVLDMISFEFVTPKEDIKSYIDSGEVEPEGASKHFCVVDISLQKLYGVELGDELMLTVKDKAVRVWVGGFVKHNLFNGNYIIVSADKLSDEDIDVDTVLVVANKNVSEVAGNIKQKYASQNYYVVSALEAFKWDKESTSAVFNLVGTLAVVVGAFILLVAVFATIVGRSGEEKSMTALLLAGMSKRDLFGAEIVEHSIIGIMAFALSLISSVAFAASLIHALALFGLYFEFMYSIWIVVVVGIVQAAAYCVAPLVMRYWKDYKLKKE